MITAEAFREAMQNIPYARYLGIGFDPERELFALMFREDLVGNRQLNAVHGGVVVNRPGKPGDHLF